MTEIQEIIYSNWAGMEQLETRASYLMNENLSMKTMDEKRGET